MIIAVVTVVILILLYIEIFETKPFFNPFVSDTVVYYTVATRPFIDRLLQSDVSHELLTFHVDDYVTNHGRFHLVERLNRSADIQLAVETLTAQGKIDKINKELIDVAQLASHYGINIVVLNEIEELLAPYNQKTSTENIVSKKISVPMDDPMRIFAPIWWVTLRP